MPELSPLPPAISVVIPVFNDAAGLQRCLASVLAQDVPSLEVLVVDDGSTDDTPAVAQAYAQRDARVRVIGQANAGTGAARNRGLAQARGEWVHFVDADDTLMPGVYAQLRAALQDKPGLEVVFCGFNEVDAVTGCSSFVNPFGLAPKQMRSGPADAWRQTLLASPVMPWTRWIRRDFLLRTGVLFDVIRFANDQTFHFRLVASCSQVLVWAWPMVNYSINRAGTLSAQAGLSRLEATLVAHGNIRHLTRDLAEPQQRLIFDKNMEDLVLLWGRVPPADKQAVARVAVDGLGAQACPFSPDDFAGSAWYAGWCVMQALARSGPPVSGDVPVVFVVSAQQVASLTLALLTVQQSLEPGKRCQVFLLHMGLPLSTLTWLQTGLPTPSLRVHAVDARGLFQPAGQDTKNEAQSLSRMRMWIPELFSAFDKVICLDACVRVQRSLHHLLEADLTGSLVAGVAWGTAVTCPGVSSEFGHEQGNERVTLHPAVLVFNTLACVQAKFRQQVEQALARRQAEPGSAAWPIDPAQEPVNLASDGPVSLLAPAWNHAERVDRSSDQDREVSGVFILRLADVCSCGSLLQAREILPRLAQTLNPLYLRILNNVCLVKTHSILQAIRQQQSVLDEF